MALIKPPFFTIARGHPQNRGLLIAYPFIGGAGLSLRDISGRNNHATMTAVNAVVPSPYGDALAFNASINGVTGTIAHNIGTGEFTVIMLVYLNASVNYSTICCFGNTAPGIYTKVLNGTWGLTFSSTDNPSGTVLSLGQWYHLCARRKAGVFDFWTNGVQDPTKTARTTTVGTSSVFRVCWDNSADAKMDGNMASLRVWNRALDDQEIRQSYTDEFAYMRPRTRRWLSLPAGGSALVAAGAGDFAGDGEAVAQATVSLAGAGALTGAGLAASLATAAWSGTGTLAAAGQSAASATMSPAGVGTLAAVGQANAQSAVSPLGVGILAGIGQATALATAASTGTGALANTGQATARATLSSTGTGALAATATSAASVLNANGAGALAGAGRAIVTSPATFSGTGALVGEGRAIALANTAPAGIGAIANIGRAQGTIVATFQGNGALAAISVLPVLSAAGTGAFAGSGRAIATSTVAYSGTGTASFLSSSNAVFQSSGTGALVGVGRAAIQQNATMTGIGALSGNGRARAIAAPVFRGTGSMAFQGIGPGNMISRGKGKLIAVGSSNSFSKTSRQIGPYQILFPSDAPVWARRMQSDINDALKRLSADIENG